LLTGDATPPETAPDVDADAPDLDGLHDVQREEKAELRRLVKPH